MKAIIITEDNIKEVYGKLRKFFYNKNKTGFSTSHSFDTGFKKRINPYIYISNEKIKTYMVYPQPESVEFHPVGSVPGIRKSFIRVRTTAVDSFILNIGDKIAFLGNRINIRQKCIFLKEHRFIYTTYQALPIDKKEQDRLRTHAHHMSMVFGDDGIWR